MAKILVIDDEPSIRTFFEDFLSRDGHEVVTVARGGDIFPVIARDKPDLILMDINVPGEKGLSLLRRMPKDQNKRVPVVIFSGKITPEIEEEAITHGALDVIQKGGDMEELRTRLNKILANKGRLDQESYKETILIIDDEESIRKSLKLFLDEKGFRVLTAPNGYDGLDLVEKEKPHMILLDVTMPGLNGIETLEKIKQLSPGAGVIMVTGVADEKTARKATRLGAYAYVLKPFDYKYLELVVLTRLMLAS